MRIPRKETQSGVISAEEIESLDNWNLPQMDGPVVENWKDKEKEQIAQVRSELGLKPASADAEKKAQMLDQQSQLRKQKIREDFQKQRMQSSKKGFAEGYEKGRQAGFEKGLQQGIEQGFSQGQQQGLEQGLQQGKAQAESEQQQLLQQQRVDFAHLVESLKQGWFGDAEADQNSPLEQLQQEIYLMVDVIARQVIQREIQTAPEQIIGVIHQSLKLLNQAKNNHSDEQPPVIYLHPEDIQLVEQLVPAESQAWQLEADASISKGGCRVQRGVSEVDATLEHRYQATAASLLDSQSADGDRQ